MPKAPRRLSDVGNKPSSLAKRRYEHQRPSTSELGYGTNWQKLRQSKLSTDPLCKRCQDKGKTRQADMVHHIRPLKAGGEHRWDNLMSLCNKCHREVHKN